MSSVLNPYPYPTHPRPHPLLGHLPFAHTHSCRPDTYLTDQVFKATEKATGKEFAFKVLNKRHIVGENKCAR